MVRVLDLRRLTDDDLRCLLDTELMELRGRVYSTRLKILARHRALTPAEKASNEAGRMLRAVAHCTTRKMKINKILTERKVGGFAGE